MSTFDNPFEGGGVSNLPLAKIDSVRGSLVCSAAIAGQPRQWQPVPIDTRLVLDWGVRFYGGISFSPTVSERVTLDGLPPPEIPQDGREWQPIIKLPVLLENRGLFMASFTGKISQNRIRPLRQLFDLCPEAQRGMLQQYILRPFEPIPLEKGTFFGLVFQPDSWVERDVAVFGPRLIPAPPPFVAGPAMPQKLTDVVMAAANDVATPADDPLARFRPVGTHRTPY